MILIYKNIPAIVLEACESNNKIFSVFCDGNKFLLYGESKITNCYIWKYNDKISYIVVCRYETITEEDFVNYETFKWIDERMITSHIRSSFCATRPIRIKIRKMTEQDVEKLSK